MTACVNCARTLQPAWKYCIFCGTRTPVAAAAARSRPLPKRTPVPGYAGVTTAQTPIVPPPAPAPLSAAPAEEPVSSEWPDSLGERPSLRSALAATDVPPPTPPREDGPAPHGEDEPPAETPEPDEPEAIEEPEPAEPEPAYPEPAYPEPDEPEPRGRIRFSRRRAAAASTTLLDEAPEVELDDDLDPLDETAADRRGSVNTLSILALLIGLLACPFAALFGHIALGQLRASGERGLIPAWIAIVLG
jgi:hypothetical protein